jgi:radical SAM/Cys-rich protein
MKSLKAQGNILADSQVQMEIIERGGAGDFILIPFQQKLQQSNLYPLTATGVKTFQVNVGKMCNQVCAHCHVDAGPDRKEIMTKETMVECLTALKNNPSLQTVDITGGAPEMNPNFQWFVEETKKLVPHIIVRCNLTIILANKKHSDLPAFFKRHNVEVVSSLPFYTKDRTDRQRGAGVFDDSIKALQLLNQSGYGVTGSGLILNLVYNPAGAFLPPCQDALQNEYRQELMNHYGIVFNNLYAITNLPVNRYLDYLLVTGNYEKYMEKLVNAYNPEAAANVMCRNTISISWDGYLYDCDFNQMLDLKINARQKHISGFDLGKLDSREIVVNQHCYGCTAGAGSGCGGAVVASR